MCEGGYKQIALLTTKMVTACGRVFLFVCFFFMNTLISSAVFVKPPMLTWPS